MRERQSGRNGVRVRDIVSDVVRECAPEELPVLTGLTTFDDATVVCRLRRGRRREPLGFGPDEVAAMVTPVVWVAVDEAARRIGGSAGSGAARRAAALFRRILHRPAPPVTVPPLTREQLAQVWTEVLEMSARRGISRQRATLIADTVVARLATDTKGSAS